MADKIVVMRDGKVEQVGEALDLYDNPGNVFVAGFIGRIIRDAGSAYGVIAEG